MSNHLIRYHSIFFCKTFNKIYNEICQTKTYISLKCGNWHALLLTPKEYERICFGSGMKKELKQQRRYFTACCLEDCLFQGSSLEGYSLETNANIWDVMYLPVCIRWCALRWELFVYTLLQPEKLKLLIIIWAIDAVK